MRMAMPVGGGIGGIVLLLLYSALTGQNPIDLGSATRSVNVADGTLAIDATLSGTLTGTGGGLQKNGDGTLQLPVANSYTGATIVNGGSLTQSLNEIGVGGTVRF